MRQMQKSFYPEIQLSAPSSHQRLWNEIKLQKVAYVFGGSDSTPLFFSSEAYELVDHCLLGVRRMI